MQKNNFDEAKDFLNKISKEDKVAVIHHDDLDGFSSGILFYDWCKQKGAEVKHFTFTISKDKIKNFDLKDCNKIIITDLGPNVLEEEWKYLEGKKVLYVDHHQKNAEVPNWILEYRTLDRGYIPCARSSFELTNQKEWLGILGTIADAGDLYPENQEFLKKFQEKNNLEVSFLKEKAYALSDTIIYFEKEPDKFFEELEKINSLEEIKSIEKYSKVIEDEIKKQLDDFEIKKEKLGEINFFYFESNFSIKSPVSSIISQKNPNQTIMVACPRNEEEISISARNQSRKINVLKIFENAIENFENAGTGGHIPAAGATIQKKDLENFKENLRKIKESDFEI